MEEGEKGHADGCYLGLDFSTQQVSVSYSQLQLSSVWSLSFIVCEWVWSLETLT